MGQRTTLTGRGLRTPRAAAIAGIVFSVLLLVIFSLLRLSVPADPSEPGAWLATSSHGIALALNLMPVAGIAFLWFIGVLRDRLGALEDRFFATVFFGSALLFLAMLFAAAAVAGAIVVAFSSQTTELSNTSSFHFARAVAYNLMNIYAIKSACVFMITASTVAIHTGFVPRWIALLGYSLALVLLLASYFMAWAFVVLPIWIFLISVHILLDVIRHPAHDRNGSAQ